MSESQAAPELLPVLELCEEIDDTREQLRNILREAYDYLHEADGIDVDWVAARINRDRAWVENRLVGPTAIDLIDMIVLATAMNCRWDFRLRYFGEVVSETVCGCEECKRLRDLEARAQRLLRTMKPAGSA
jgi:superfamily II DNA helicase RecQ